MTINLKKTAIFQAVKFGNSPLVRWNQFFKILFFTLFLLYFTFYLSTAQNFKLTVLFFLIFLFLVELNFFFNSKLKNLSFRPFADAILNLGYETAEAFWRTLRKKENLILSLLKLRNREINFVFNRGLVFNFLKDNKALKDKLFSEEQDLEKIIFSAAKIVSARNKEKIEIGDLLIAIFENSPIFQRILMEINLKKDDLLNLISWSERIQEKISFSKRFWEKENLLKKGSIASDWASGYTITLDQFSTDWTEIIKKKGFEEIIGHQEEIAQIERILSRREINNVLLIGEPGTGGMSIVQELARKSFFNLSLPEVNSKRVVVLDIVSILSRAGSPEEVEAVLDRIFKEAITAGNVILVIDDFHNYIGQETRPGIIDITGAITPYLALPQFQIIALTNFPGFHKFIEPNPSLLNLFEKVEVLEISENETIYVLENLALLLERKYKLFITYQAIRDIVSLSARYFPNLLFPKKAMDLLDEIAIYVSHYTRAKFILPEHVARVVSDKTQIPVGEVEKKEKEILLNLEKLIHQRIINQEEAVKEISTALRRARADITVRKGPMGGFLFLGPTGVGKTESSKALAEVYFGSEDKMIRLDMSEFQNISDIKRLLGSIEEEGLLTTSVRENPFSLILLDEIEKAHKNILNLFLQVLDEGYLTDGLGRKVDFKNTIIIATSNAGYQIILEALKKNKPMAEIKDKLLDFLFKEGIFRPEFINRFDAMVVFKSLTKENLMAIAELLLQKLKKNLSQKNIDLEITLPLKEKIVELGYNPIFGAREIRRVIQDKVENILASAILSGKIKTGNKVKVDSKDFSLIVK